MMPPIVNIDRYGCAVPDCPRHPNHGDHMNVLSPPGEPFVGICDEHLEQATEDEGDVMDERVYAAAKAHAAARGIDLAEWPNQQALVPDEVRYMRAALAAYRGDT